MVASVSSRYIKTIYGWVPPLPLYQAGVHHRRPHDQGKESGEKEPDSQGQELLSGGIQVMSLQVVFGR